MIRDFTYIDDIVEGTIHVVADRRCGSERRKQAPVLYSRGFCPRLRGAQRNRHFRVQVHSPVRHYPDEGGLFWNDPAIGIEWPVGNGFEPLLSEKDTKNPLFAEALVANYFNRI